MRRQNYLPNNLVPSTTEIVLLVLWCVEDVLIADKVLFEIFEIRLVLEDQGKLSCNKILLYSTY